MNEKVMNELIKTRNVLREKFKSIKLGDVEAEKTLEKTFKPITKPLNKFLNSIENDERKDIKVKSDGNFGLVKSSTPFKSFKTKSDADDGEHNSLHYNNESGQFIGIPMSVDDIEDEDERQTEENDNIRLENVEVLAKRPSTKPLRLDRCFGPRKDLIKKTWLMGDSIISFNKDKVIIGDKKWTLSNGLHELLFYNNPMGYTQSDLRQYKEILNETHVHRRNFQSDGALRSSKSYKYKKVIRKLFPPKNILLENTEREGGTLMKLNLKKTNYVYWDDPNELVDRLRLLVSSSLAGHTNHNNEIVSIVNELKCAKIIV